MQEIDPQQYAHIEALIGDPESVVGIDAKKTHILILHKLMELEKQVHEIHERLDEMESAQEG